MNRVVCGKERSLKDAGLQPCRVPRHRSNLGNALARDVAGSGCAAVVPTPGMLRDLLRDLLRHA